MPPCSWRRCRVPVGSWSPTVARPRPGEQLVRPCSTWCIGVRPECTRLTREPRSAVATSYLYESTSSPLARLRSRRRRRSRRVRERRLLVQRLTDLCAGVAPTRRCPTTPQDPPTRSRCRKASPIRPGPTDDRSSTTANSAASPPLARLSAAADGADLRDGLVFTTGSFEIAIYRARRCRTSRSARSTSKGFRRS